MEATRQRGEPQRRLPGTPSVDSLPAMRGFRAIPVIVLAAATAGCSSASSNMTSEMLKPSAGRIYVCHGFDCRRKTKLDLTEADGLRFASIMAAGKASAEAERAAVSKAVQYFEDRAAAAIGVRDKPKSDLTQSGLMGQMDCIDESSNTRLLLLHLEARGLIRHHKVEGNVSRGAFVDGRYPHSTAVLRDPQGKRWAIDSWYEPAGGPPDIMPLEAWQKRGVLGER